MTPSRWQQIEALYNAAGERKPADRGAFLAEVCAGDAELRREVEALLAQDASKPNTFDRPAWEGTAILDATTATMAALTPGMMLGPYKIEGQIGKGGMGEVFRAKDTKLKRDVAIKVLADLFTNDLERLARFQREAQVLASLNHPNIAHIYGLEDSNGIRALVMELVEGPTLADRVAKGPIPVEEALLIAKQIAEAFEAAHEVHVLHRDLQPANIQVRLDGVVKVLDFGLAKALAPALADAPTPTTIPTQVGAIMGTPAYMSPEQARGEAAGPQADIWSFGVVL